MSRFDEQTTVLIPTSSIPIHPDTRMIRTVIDSVRHWFPTSWIHVMADGLRPEFLSRQQAYEYYLQRLRADTASDPRIRIKEFPRHCHQTTMMIDALNGDWAVETPLVMFCEHDISLLTDRLTDWQMMADAILDDQCDLVRLMLTEEVHPLHLYLYSGELPGYPYLWKQKQFSGWSHLASAAWYRRLLAGFDTRAKLTVERYVGRLIEPAPWERNRMCSYVPDPGRAKRIHHLDGRADPSRDNGNGRDENYESQEIYPPPL